MLSSNKFNRSNFDLDMDSSFNSQFHLGSFVEENNTEIFPEVLSIKEPIIPEKPKVSLIPRQYIAHLNSLYIDIETMPIQISSEIRVRKPKNQKLIVYDLNSLKRSFGVTVEEVLEKSPLNSISDVLIYFVKSLFEMDVQVTSSSGQIELSFIGNGTRLDIFKAEKTFADLFLPALQLALLKSLSKEFYHALEKQASFRQKIREIGFVLDNVDLFKFPNKSLVKLCQSSLSPNKISKLFQNSNLVQDFVIFSDLMKQSYFPSESDFDEKKSLIENFKEICANKFKMCVYFLEKKRSSQYNEINLCCENRVLCKMIVFTSLNYEEYKNEMIIRILWFLQSGEQYLKLVRSDSNIVDWSDAKNENEVVKKSLYKIHSSVPVNEKKVRMSSNGYAFAPDIPGINSKLYCPNDNEKKPKNPVNVDSRPKEAKNVRKNSISNVQEKPKQNKDRTDQCQNDQTTISNRDFSQSGIINDNSKVRKSKSRVSQSVREADSPQHHLNRSEINLFGQNPKVNNINNVEVVQIMQNSLASNPQFTQEQFRKSSDPIKRKPSIVSIGPSEFSDDELFNNHSIEESERTVKSGSSIQILPITKGSTHLSTNTREETTLNFVSRETNKLNPKLNLPSKNPQIQGPSKNIQSTTSQTGQSRSITENRSFLSKQNTESVQIFSASNPQIPLPSSPSNESDPNSDPFGLNYCIRTKPVNEASSGPELTIQLLVKICHSIRQILPQKPPTGVPDLHAIFKQILEIPDLELVEFSKLDKLKDTGIIKANLGKVLSFLFFAWTQLLESRGPSIKVKYQNGSIFGCEARSGRLDEGKRLVFEGQNYEMMCYDVHLHLIKSQPLISDLKACVEWFSERCQPNVNRSNFAKNYFCAPNVNLETQAEQRLIERISPTMKALNKNINRK